MATPSALRIPEGNRVTKRSTGDHRLSRARRPVALRESFPRRFGHGEFWVMEVRTTPAAVSEVSSVRGSGAHQRGHGEKD